MNYLQKSELEHGAYYKGSCRNATEARWNSKHNSFWYWRTKFSYTFIEEVKHPDEEEYYDVFYPEKKLEVPTKEIIFYETV